jgi:hypothetical protein
MLDECYPVTKIGYSEFDASYIMKHLDPIAYRECCNDYANSLIEDGYVIEGYNDEDENE